MLGAEAQLQQSQINLGYTDIRAPIDGKIGRTTVTVGNYVSPSSGVLATIVSQDPMHVVFAVSSRSAIALRHRATGKPIVIKIRLADGRIYDQSGTLNFFDNTVAGNTDTITLRGDVRNPLADARMDGTTRELVDGEFVTAILEDAEPIEAVTVPRAAVLTDQQGDYIYVVDSENKVQQRRVQLGPSTPVSLPARADSMTANMLSSKVSSASVPPAGVARNCRQRRAPWAPRHRAKGETPMISAVFIADRD